MTLAHKLRRAATSTIERSPALRRRIVDSAASVARRRGAHPAIVAEATQVEDRPLERSLQIIAWARAIAGHGSFPRHFNPGDHLSTAAAREAAAQALRQADATAHDNRLQRDLIHIGDEGIDVIGRRVHSHLEALLDERSSRPQRGDGLDPMRQLEIVDELTRALGAVGVRPFLMSGTLLGFVRNGSFLPHDYDIDLGLLPGVDIDTVVDAVRAIGSYTVSIAGPRAIAVDPSGIVVDLFEHQLRDGLFWHATRVHEWWNTPFEVVANKMDGRRVWVPANASRYLNENYGSWAESVPFYDISFDTPNRRYLHTADTLRFLHSRCVRALERGDRWLLESASRELRDEFGIDVTNRLAPTGLLDSSRTG